MSIKTFDEIIKKLRCEHDFEDEPCGFSLVGRFGGESIPVYKCKKCGNAFAKSEDCKMTESKYNEGGRLNG